jgi:hypothetical protein
MHKILLLVCIRIHLLTCFEIYAIQGLLGRSNTYNGSQPRVVSGKQRNTSTGSSLLYPVKYRLFFFVTK